MTAVLPRTVAEMFHFGTCQFITCDIRAEHSFCGEAKYHTSTGITARHISYCENNARQCFKPFSVPPLRADNGA